MANSTPRRDERMRYGDVIDHILSLKSNTNGKIARRAFREFVAEVDPENEDEEGLYSAFMEWFLFDWDYKNGKSPLEHFIDYHPANFGEKAIDGLRQSAQTHFTSEFWIIDVLPEKNILVLEEISSGKVFHVRDVSASHSLAGTSCGQIGTRLVLIDDVWYFPGNPVYYYPIKPTKRLKAMMRETEAGRQPSFIELVKRLYGHKEPLDKADIGGAVIDMTPDERASRLEEIEAEVTLLHQQGKSEMTWEELKEAIAKETEQPIDLLHSFLGVDIGGEVPFDSEDELGSVVSLIFDAWNLLPHDSLDGKSPAEMVE